MELGDKQPPCQRIQVDTRTTPFIDQPPGPPASLDDRRTRHTLTPYPLYFAFIIRHKAI
jgi:hypothetical protein